VLVGQPILAAASFQEAQVINIEYPSDRISDLEFGPALILQSVKSSRHLSVIRDVKARRFPALS